MRSSKSCTVPLVSELHFRACTKDWCQESPTCPLKVAVHPQSVVSLLRNRRITDLYSHGVEGLHDDDGTDQKKDVVLGSE